MWKMPGKYTINSKINGSYPQRCLLAYFEATLYFRCSDFTCTLYFLFMLLCASKFATAKIECSFEIGKYTPLGLAFILLLMIH